MMADFKEEIRETSPNLETLFGDPPTYERLSDGTHFYSYTGLDKPPNKEKLSNAALIEIPMWGGVKVLMLHRPSLKHNQQDASGLLVDQEKKWIGLARADGVTQVIGKRDNRSGRVAAGLIDLLKTVSMRKIGTADWNKAVTRALKLEHKRATANIIPGASTFQITRIGRVSRSSKDKTSNWHIDSIFVGSNRKEKKGKLVMGDRGALEVFFETATSDRPTEFEKKIVKKPSYIGNPNVNASVMVGKAHSNVDASSEPVYVVQYTDGINAISRGGRWNAPGVQVKDVIKNGLTQETAIQAWKMLRGQGQISFFDDVTLLVVILPVQYS